LQAFPSPINQSRALGKKIADNLERDERKKRELEKLGYRVLTVWQCQLKKSVEIYNLEKNYTMKSSDALKNIGSMQMCAQIDNRSYR